MAGTFSLTRRTTVVAPARAVHAAINDFHEWVHWSPWEGIDPNLQRTYTGPQSGVGAAYAWKGSRKVGEGQMEITGSSPGSVVLDLQFIKPFKATNVTTFTLTEHNGSTEVSWTMSGAQNALMKVMSLVFPMERTVGRDFEKGLQQLKSYVETGAGNSQRT